MQKLTDTRICRQVASALLSYLATLLPCCLFTFTPTPLHAQPDYDVTRYDESSGLSQAHATQILQSPDGFLWLATWNGLCRFDGYEFQRMASQAGDGCNMPSDRIRDIWLTADDNLYCKVDEDLYFFDTRTYRFRDITSNQERQQAEQMHKDRSKRGHFNGQFIEFTDRQGLHWQLRGDDVYRLRPIRQPAQPVAQQQPAQTRCIARDRQGRIWVTTKEDATVRLFDNQLNSIGYLRPDGHIQSAYTTFGTPVYCITQSRDGILWLGSKPGGLFRYDEQHHELHAVEGLPHHNIYDIKEDRWGRLWLATLGGGIVCYDPRQQTIHQFLPTLKVRYLHLTPDDVLLATTTEGLVVGQLSADAKNTPFHRHLREARRQTSLSCNATMDLLQDGQGRLYVSTESGGVCEIVSRQLTADTLSFRRLPMQGGWPTDVVLSLAIAANGRMLITSSHQLIEYDPSQSVGNTFDSWFFHHPYRFSEVRPLLLADGRWLMGSNEGAFTLDSREMQRTPYVPNIVLTGVSIQNGLSDLAVNELDTLLLSPDERNLTIHFAALDYTNAERIRYEFYLDNGESRNHGDQKAWNSLGHDHAVTLLDLKPGTYQLWLCSTNADGIRVDNQRRLVIIAQPTFLESTLGRLLILLLIVGALSAIAYTYIYIRRIKRKQRETLEAYLALVEQGGLQSDGSNTATTAVAGTPSEREGTPSAEHRDPLLQRVMAFVEQNIGNADVSIGDMASAAATSRSGLQRKLRQSMGITPQDLLREARIKRACQLLRTTSATVADVAYACGFTDPKYFSRCFKQSVGQSPTDYKSTN